MKIQRKHIAYFIFTIFICYAMNYNVFERKLFFNEFLSGAGIVIFLYELFKVKGRVTVPKSKIYKIILLLIGLGLFQLIRSLPLKTSYYYYFRNSVIVYSIFTFFIGFFLFPYFKDFLKKAKVFIISYLIAAMSLKILSVEGSSTLLDRMIATGFFPFIIKKGNLRGVVIIALLGVLYIIAYNALTTVVVIGLFLIIRSIRHYTHFKIGAGIAGIGIVALFLYLSPSLALYKQGPYLLFGNVHKVYRSNPIFQIDHNTSWRTVFWYRVIVDRFPENVGGIGLGTPLIPYRKDVKTTESEYTDEYDAHVTGAHNSYITLFIRLGIPYLILTLYLYHLVFKDYYSFKEYYRQHNLNIYFWSFFIVSMVALFNLVMESPTLAATYWVTLGFVARAMSLRGEGSIPLASSEAAE